MLHGAFVLKMKTSEWRLCVVKQVPEQRESSWMLFGQHKSLKKFQMEFQSHQETILVRHLVKMASSVDDDFHADLRLVLVAESPAISCIESLWPLKGLEMYRTKPNHLHDLHDALHQDVYMLSLSPQMQDPKMQDHQIAQPQQISQPPSQSNHPMQTRSRKH
jgi:hypothetical protein